jgi:hypothetical protein
VHTGRINATGINEPKILLYTHPFFGRINKLVVLAMKKSIKAGANRACRKVDLLSDEDERKMLAILLTKQIVFLAFKSGLPGFVLRVFSSEESVNCTICNSMISRLAMMNEVGSVSGKFY